MRADIRAFFDEDTSTVSYVIADPASRRVAILDSVLDYDPAAGRIATRSADAIVAHVRERGFTVEWILETHVHADHLTAAAYLKKRLGGILAIGAKVAAVQATFAKIYNLGPDFRADGSQFERLFADGDSFRIGGVEVRVMATPGHTPACVTYVLPEAAFVGDTMFMPDYGSARCDFPGGDARILYRSIRRIFALAPATRLYMLHDYKAPGRDQYAWETSVAEQRAGNIHLHDGVGEDDFVKLRTERDRKLTTPKLILPAVQVNMRAGEMPPPESNGMSYLKIPLNAL